VSYRHVQGLLLVAEDYLAARQAVVGALADTGLLEYAMLGRAEGSLL